MSAANRASCAESVLSRIAAFFAERGYQPVEPAMLLPAETVLDHMGEDIRRRLLITTAPDGSEHALRPDFTLPLALWQIERGPAEGGRYSYAGFAFRFPQEWDRTRRSAEFRQAGIEHFGAEAPDEADAEIMAAAIEALGMAGVGEPEIVIGDVGLFAALVDSLGLPGVWQSRLRRLFWRHRASGDIASAFTRERDRGTGRDAALGHSLAGMDRDEARALIGEVMAIAGVSGAAGRDAGEIAARFVQKAREAEGESPGNDIAQLVERYLDIEVAAVDAAATLERFARDAGLDLGAAIGALQHRLELIVARGVDLGQARFATTVGRRIEYYTGYVFEARARGRSDLGPLASGGRYDRFLTDLGASQSLSAVGCSIYVDRVAVLAGEGS